MSSEPQGESLLGDAVFVAVMAFFYQMLMSGLGAFTLVGVPSWWFLGAMYCVSALLATADFVRWWMNRRKQPLTDSDSS